jgi:hypothetical protein
MTANDLRHGVLLTGPVPYLPGLPDQQPPVGAVCRVQGRTTGLIGATRPCPLGGRQTNVVSATLLAFEALQDRRCGSRTGRISGDGKLSCKSLQQLVGRCRNAVYPAEEHNLAVEVVRLDVAGSATQTLPRGPAGSGLP